MMEVFPLGSHISRGGGWMQEQGRSQAEAWPRPGSVPTAAGAAAKIPVQVTALARAYFFSAETCSVKVCGLKVAAVKDVCVKVCGVEDGGVEI